MGFRKLSLCSYLLAFSLTHLATDHILAQDPLHNADVIISDDFADFNQPSEIDYDRGVKPAQFQSGARSRTAASPASMAGAGQRTPQAFNIRLARAPKMMGDFYNLPGQSAIVGELFPGLAVHQTIASGSVFANNNIAIITTDQATDKTVFLGGPGGITPGTFYDPPIDPSVITNPQPNLRLDGDNVNFYTAVLNGETKDVFDNPQDTLPSIPNAPVYQMFQVTEVSLGGPNPGDLVGRVRIQDNNNAMPTDRIFLDYNYFHNVPFTANGIDVNRLTPGVEKTFFNQMASVEVRVPMAVTYNSNQFLSTAVDTSEPEFGNVAIIPKVLLTSNSEMAVAAGLGIALPTADNINVYGQSGSQLLSVENESVHLIPFLACLYTPQGADYFVQVFVTLDVDANGNAVNADVGSGSLEQIGIWNDQSLASGSLTVGKYLFQNYSRSSIVKSFSAVSELHYTGTASDADTVDSGPFLLGNANHDLSLLNGTFGGHLRLQNSSFTGGYTVPLTSSDRIFDGEFRLFINQFF